jgi:hypothetical protein
MSCFAPNSVLKRGVLRFHVFDLVNFDRSSLI